MRIYKAAFVYGALSASLAAFLFTMGAFEPWTRTVFGSDAPAPHCPQWLGAVLLGFGLAWTTLDIRSVTLKAAIAAVALIETATLSWLLAWHGIFWPPFTALVAGAAAFLLGLLHSVSRAGRRRRLAEEILDGKISSATFEQVLESGQPFPFAGEERQATVVACRFFNRAELAETLPAADFVALTNAFSRTVSEALKEAGGVIVEGDGEHVHAVFGALLGDAGHAGRACRAALALLPKLDAFRHTCREAWGADPDCRAAVESGPVIAGVFGMPGNGGFGIVGEAFDAARRLCQANLFYGTRLISGSRAFLAARAEIEARPADLVWNRELREEIYELLAPHGGLSPEALQRRDAFWKGVILFRSRRWEEALAVLGSLDERETDDPLLRFYLEQLAAHLDAA